MKAASKKTYVSKGYLEEYNRKRQEAQKAK